MVFDMESLCWICLPDPAAPSFATSTNVYLGTQESAALLGQPVVIKKILPCNLVGTREICISPWSCTYRNIWGFPYHMRAEELRTILYYCQLDEAYLRAAAYRFKSLELDTKNGKWRTLCAADSWGVKGVLSDADDGALEGQILFIDRYFDSLTELTEEMRSPQPPEYSHVLDQIFGDG